MSELLLIALGSILVLGIAAQWIAWKLHLPSILLLLIFGFFAGPAGFNLIDPTHLFGDLLFPFVSLAVAIILFEGGLTLHFNQIPGVRNVILRLISVGAVITWGVSTLAARFILGMDLTLSVLLGAVLIVTGPTVISPLLQQIRPKGQAGVALKWEGILIDPVGAILAVLIFEMILSGRLHQAPVLIALGAIQVIAIGTVLGLSGAIFMIYLLRNHWIPDHLQNSFALLVAIGTFVLSDVLYPESGLLTVTVLGIAMANQKIVSIRHLVEFKENLTVLLISSLFIILSARLTINEILAFGWRGPLFMAILVFIARPLATFASAWGSKLSLSERVFIAWMAPRGIVAAAVASIFAFELEHIGIENATQVEAAVFLVIVTSVTLYGLTAAPLARWLKLSERDPQGAILVGAHLFARQLALVLKQHGFNLLLMDTNPRNVRLAKSANLTVIQGDALSEEMLDVELTGIGRMLALTPNHEVNSLATLHYSELFGRGQVFQLPPRTQQSAEETGTPHHLRGRFLFAPHANCAFLRQQLADGSTIQSIPIDENFNLESLQAKHNNGILPLFLVTAANKLLVFTIDTQPTIRPGRTLIALVPPSMHSDGG